MSARRWVTTGVLGALGIGGAGLAAAAITEPPGSQTLPAVRVSGEEAGPSATPDPRATDPASPAAGTATTAASVPTSATPAEAPREAATAAPAREPAPERTQAPARTQAPSGLLYTSDAADDSLRVDLGGRRIIKKKKHTGHCGRSVLINKNTNMPAQ